MPDIGVRSWADRCMLLAVLALLVVGGCSPRTQEIGPDIVSAHLLPDAVVTPDGAVLPLQVWQPAQSPSAVILALHGFNDYSRAFERPAAPLNDARVLVYAFDQRGFGRTREPGIWAGTEVLVSDAQRAIELVRATHPNLPLYVLGESMGGAVATVAVARSETPVDGLILVAPAYWGWRSMTPVEGFSLEVMSWLTPWLPLTGEGLRITPTDNIDVLREMAQDPLVLKESRVDGIFGLVNLMDVAFESLDQVQVPVLMLYGAREDILPVRAVSAAIDRLNDCEALPESRCAPRVAFYEDGYHMLLRDLNAPVVVADIVAWMGNQGAALPSGADRDPPEEVMAGLTAQN